MSITGKILFSGPQESHWSKIIAWDQAYFSRPWMLKDWSELDLKNHIILIWEKAGVPVGFALYQTLSGDEAAHLYKIFLLSEFRGSSEAECFFQESIKILKDKGFLRVYLEVEADNGRAIRFYEKMHFKHLRRVKAFYSDGVDALTMELTL